MQNVSVAVVGSAYDQLRALSRRSEHRRVPVFGQLRLALRCAVPYQPHRAQNGLSGLVRRQRLQALMTGQLDIHAEPVGQKPQLPHQLRRRAGDGLGVDVPVEPVFLPQNAQRPDHQLHGVIGAAQNAAGEKQPLDIIPPVKADGQLRQLPRRKRRAARVVAAPVDAVFAVVYAGVAQQHLQQRDAPSVGGKAVAAPGDRGGGVPDHARAEPAPYAAGGAGRVVFGCVRQDRQLVQKLHVLLRRAAATAGRGLIDAVDEPHNVGGDGAGAQQGDDKTECCHDSVLLCRTLVLVIV